LAHTEELVEDPAQEPVVLAIEEVQKSPTTLGEPEEGNAVDCSALVDISEEEAEVGFF